MSEEMPESNQPPRRIRLSETEGFSREGFGGQVYPLPGSTFNALRVNVHGTHPRKRMRGDTTRNYLVIDGTGRFTIRNETYEVLPGDLFVIPPEGEYQYEGEMTLFEFNISPSGKIQDQEL